MKGKDAGRTKVYWYIYLLHWEPEISEIGRRLFDSSYEHDTQQWFDKVLVKPFAL